MNRNKIPRWLLTQEGLTGRQWKTIKRRQWGRVVEALDEYAMGSVYSPSYADFKRIQNLVDCVAAALTQRNWGR